MNILNLSITGIYFLTPEIFQKIKKLQPSWRNELEIVDALQMILDSKGQINYDIIADFWKDIGSIISNNSEIFSKNENSKNKKLLGEGTKITF